MVLAAFAACAAGPHADPITGEPAAAFDWSVGSWHGARLGADGSTAAMTVRVEPLAHGTGQLECLRVDAADGAPPYVGFTVRSFDAGTQRWVMTYANAPDHAFARLRGEGTGALIVFDSTTSAHGSRLVSEQVDPVHWRRQQFTSADGGRTWTLLFTDELERDR
jgi:hypothetical protein